MDRANYELARWLAEHGARVHLVTHRIEPDLAALPNVVCHIVPRPFDAHAIDSSVLDYMGRRILRRCVAEEDARVIVNGGACHYYDVNWVHAVHAAWTVRDEGAPLRARAKNRIQRWRHRRAESTVLRRSRLVLANSEKTRSELVSLVGVDERNVRVVYLGCDPRVDRPASPDAIAQRRAALGLAPGELFVLFAGALGYDRNKGLDTLIRAWKLLREAGAVHGRVLAAGTAYPLWHEEIASHGLTGEVELLGYRKDLSDLLAAADLVVAPSRYDSYGLTVQEALCRHVPAITSSHSGVSERYPATLQSLVLKDPEDARALADQILAWTRDRARVAPEVARLGDHLREHTWSRMAEQMVEAAGGL
jgi:glycosyltransferase involved in cell wall biosynthesis